MKNTLRNSNFGFTKWCAGMALLRSEPRRRNRSFAGLRASLLLALTAGWMGAASSEAAALLEENFTFTGALTSNGWTAADAGGTSVINASTPSLSYTGLASSGIGGAASLTTSGEDDRRTFTSQSGDVYASCLINLSAAQATGGYFFALSSGTTGFISRVFAKSSGSGFVLGLSKSTTTATYDSTVLNFNTTYLVVIKIAKNAVTTSDDVSSLWVNPVLGGSETTPLLTSTTTNDQAAVDSVIVRQGSATTAPTLKVDSILVATTWAEVTPLAGGGGGTPPTVTGISPASGLAGTIVTITGTDFAGATAVSFNGVAATSFTVDSATSITATVPTSATTGPIYVTTTGGTGSSSGNFTVPVLSIAVSGGNSINEGDNTQKATVTATPAPTSDLTITLTSSSAADLTVDGGSGAGASSTATIFANTTEASFFLNAPADNTIDNNASVNLTATAVSGYGSGTAIVTVRNVDFNPPTIVVNKAYNSGLANGAGDVVELLVIGNGTPGSTLNLQGMILKDYSDGAASDGGGAYIFSNAPLWSSVKAGTLIVLTKPGTTLPAEDVDTADFVIKVNLSNSTYFTAGTDNFNLGETDLIQIKAPSSAQAGSIGVIHSFAIGTTSAAQVDAAPLPKLICFNSGNNPFAISSTKTLADFNGTGAAQSASPLGMGIPNNTDNATYISILRGSPSNSAPTGISLSSLSIAENNAVNAVVGTLSTTDADFGDTFTYSLVAGTGSTDNASFNISGSSLRAGVDFNFEARSSYSIRVRTTDSVGGTFEKVLEITVTNVTDSPAEYKADWLAANGLPAGSSWNSDPNNVGYSLATAYAFGLSPIVRSGAPVTLVSSSAGSVKVVYLQRDISSGVTYAVKTGTDLSAGLNGSVTPTPSTVQPSPGKIGYTQYEATYTPAAPATKGFLQVQAFVP